MARPKILLKRIFIAGIVVFLVAQAFRPERTNPVSDPSHSILNDPVIPPPMLDRLQRTCFDCHSNGTHWPWYSLVTPVNFLLTRDVNGGRSHMNMSEWMTLKPGKRASLLERISDEVTDGTMPLAPYAMMHADAQLTPADRKALADWASAAQDTILAQLEQE